MPNRARVIVVAVAAAFLCLGSLSSAQDAPQPWIHVEVVGDGDDAGNVSVNLPLAAAEVLM